jgi:hypothetical protein
MKPLKDMILEKYPDFYKNLDPNLKLFAREIKKDLRNQGHVVLGITGYPGKGKSNDVAIIGSLIDDDYSFEDNISFIPTAKGIESMYLNLKPYSFLHVDEASRGLHKHKWHEKVQQKLNELYDTEREGHFLCSALIMPRFQNFAENFRNFMITYWIHIPQKGLILFYKKDENKDAKDPWHMDENYKLKQKRFRGKRVFERTLPEQIRAEQVTDCYWFYCEIPAIPKEIWEEYQKLKKESRVVSTEVDTDNLITGKEKASQEKRNRMNKVYSLYKEGKKCYEIAVIMGITRATVSNYLALLRAEQELKGTLVSSQNTNLSLYNTLSNSNSKET